MLRLNPGIVVNDDLFPGYFDVFEDQHAVRFVKAVGQRAVEFDRVGAIERSARPQR